jgi:hypothetical protein
VSTEQQPSGGADESTTHTVTDLEEWKAFQRWKQRQKKAEETRKAASVEELSEFEAFRAKKEQADAAKQTVPPDPVIPAYPYDVVFGLPDETTTPAGYRVNTGGVYARQMIGIAPQWVQIALAPLVVTATYSDPNGDQAVELAWLDRGRVVRRTVSRGIARRGRELVKELGAVGLPVVESDARAVERWLAQFEAANLGAIPHRYLARWLGWQPDGTFVSTPDDGVKVDVTYDEQVGPAKAHRRGGTAAGWKAGIAALERFPIPRIVIAASLAAPLLRPLDVQSFTVDISSRSTGGKTTSLQSGLSVWANPSQDAEAIATWRTTLISIEKRLNLVRGIVTVLDETMTAESEEIISSILYDLPKNVGKARGGGWPSRLQWETVLLSTGERPALSYSTHQGAAARVLSLTTAPFGNGGGPAAVALRECVTTHYGHAGPEFVRHLLDGLTAPNGAELLRKKHKELTNQLLGNNDMTARRAPMVAAVVLAEQLAHKWGVLPYKPMPVEQWQQMFAEADQTDNRPEMAMDVLRQYIAAHEAELYRPARYPAEERLQPHGGWLGLIVTGKNGAPDQVAIGPQRVREILDRAGYALDAVLQGWRDSKYLVESESYRPPYLIKKKLRGTPARYLVFTSAAIDYGSKDDDE